MQALQQSLPVASERQWAAAAHLAAFFLALLTSWVAGVGGALGALAVLLMVRERPFAAEHAREALNFNLSMLIYACLALAIAIALAGITVLTLGIGLLVTLPAGLLLLLAVGGLALLWLVCSLIAAVKAWNGERYRYPLTIRLVS